METDPTTVPIVNEQGGEEREVAPVIATPEKLPSQEEELARAPEALQETITEMEDSSTALIERATANPLDTVVIEQGAALGLFDEEISSALASEGYAERDEDLRGKAQTLYGNFRARLAQAAQVGVAALAIGASAPASAGQEVAAPPTMFHMAQTLENPGKSTQMTEDELHISNSFPDGKVRAGYGDDPSKYTLVPEELGINDLPDGGIAIRPGANNHTPVEGLTQPPSLDAAPRQAADANQEQNISQESDFLKLPDGSENWSEEEKETFRKNREYMLHRSSADDVTPELKADFDAENIRKKDEDYQRLRRERVDDLINQGMGEYEAHSQEEAEHDESSPPAYPDEEMTERNKRMQELTDGGLDPFHANAAVAREYLEKLKITNPTEHRIQSGEE